MTWIHVYPVNDWIEHNTESLNCICEPRIDWDNMIVVHNSADGRELKEDNNGKEKRNSYANKMYLL